MTTINPYWSAIRRLKLYSNQKMKQIKDENRIKNYFESHHLFVHSETKEERILTGREAFQENQNYKKEYSSQVQNEIDAQIPFGQTQTTLTRWFLKQQNIKDLPMKKTKQNAKTASVATTPKMKITPAMDNLIVSQCTAIEGALAGSVRVRAERWHGSTSVYNTHRILNFLNDSSASGMINLGRYNTLAKEIPTFFKAIGPNLVRAISAASTKVSA